VQVRYCLVCLHKLFYYQHNIQLVYNCLTLHYVTFDVLFKYKGAISGGVDEETFIRSFEDVPKIQLYSARELEEQLTHIKSIIQDPNNDWSKRAEAVFYYYCYFFIFTLCYVAIMIYSLKKFVR